MELVCIFIIILPHSFSLCLTTVVDSGCVMKCIAKTVIVFETVCTASHDSVAYQRSLIVVPPN